MDSILKKHFDKFCEKGLLPPELCEQEECKNCKLFDDKELLKTWRSNFKGISMEDSEGNILHGAIDNLLIKGKYETIGDLSKKIELSTAMLYRAIDELKDMDLISTEDGFKLTDAGKIARL
jgi:hypothetical protein